MKNEKLEKILLEVSHNCLKSEPVPEILKELWRDQLSGYCFIQNREYGNLTLVSSYKDDFYEGYDAEFIGNKQIAWAYSKMFEEIAFIGQDAEGGLIGFWRYEPDIKIVNAPIILLDNEGQFFLMGDNIQNYLMVRSEDELNNSAQKLAHTIKEYLAERNLEQAKDIGEIKAALRKYPNPEDRYETYYSSWQE